MNWCCGLELRDYSSNQIELKSMLDFKPHLKNYISEVSASYFFPESLT